MIDVFLTPAELEGVDLSQSQVVVLDVLRATTTMVTALANGAKEIWLFDTLEGARVAKASPHMPIPMVLAGETKCLKPVDFDVGNSPREFVTERIGGATVLLATTNGTRAAVRAQGAKKVYAACLLNAAATTLSLLPELDGLHTLFVCAGTNGKVAFEDVLGAGAILFNLMQTTYRADLPFTDNAWLAYHAFAGVRQRLPAALRLGAGGINVIDAGLEEDIDHAAHLDGMPIVAQILADPLRVVRG